MTQFGGEEAPVYADRFDIYTGNANPDLARKICRYLGVERSGRRWVNRRGRHLTV